MPVLDSIITAMDVGFSYDGIVTIPETGLEDVGYRPGLAGWLDGGVVRPLLLLPTTITNQDPPPSQDPPPLQV